MRFWLIFVALATALLSPAGCVGQGSDEGNGPPGGAPADQQDDQGDGGVPPAPDGGDNDQQAPGAPIDIPEITRSQGSLLVEARPKLEEKIRKRCGGSLCVELRIEHRDIQGYTKCQYHSTDPPAGTRVRRGAVVAIVTGNESCESSSGNGEGSPDGGSPGQESPSDEASPDGETSPDGEAPGEGQTSPG